MKRILSLLFIALLLVPFAAAPAQSQASASFLLVGPIEFSDENLTEGRDIDILVNVTNIAPFDRVNISVVLYRNMQVLGEQKFNIPAMSYTTLSFPWTTQRGISSFSAVAVTEQGAISPPFSRMFYINSSVEVTPLVFSNDNPQEGDDVAISFNVFNNNSAPIKNLTVVLAEWFTRISFMAGADVEPGMSVDTNEIINMTDISLAANESRTFTGTWPSEFGNRTFIVAVAQETPYGNETLVQKQGYVNVEHEYYSPLIAGGAILGVMLSILVIAILPSIIFGMKNGS